MPYSAPETPVTAMSRITSGATVMVSAIAGSASCVSHTSSPESFLIRSMRPSSVFMITESFHTATPRLLIAQQATLPAQSLSTPGS